MKTLVNKVIPIIVMLMVLAGCASMTPSQQGTAQGTAIGTGVGAATGAAIGALAGDAGIGAAIGAGVGAVGGYVWSSRMEEQKRQMKQATAGTDIQVSQTANNQLKMNIPSDISFDSGRAEIKPEMYPVLNSLVAGLMSNPNAQANIVGHTDNTGNDSINNPLSVNRAANTRSYLASQGIQPNRISIDGRGSYEPEVPNDSPMNRARNRRVEIFIFEPQQPQTHQQQMQQQQMQQQQMQQQQMQYPPAY
jgi:outer membrane protein OmpA-like peptidoglycan-associated protein